MQLDLSGPMIADFKSQAKHVRAQAQDDGNQMSHAQALEHVAHEHGARDWNTLRAKAAKPLSLSPGMRVRGRYLGQAFTGRLHAVSLLGVADQLRVTVHFDAPVDVVRFDSFSSFRQRVSAVIGRDGRSSRATSDGTPHLELTSVLV